MRNQSHVGQQSGPGLPTSLLCWSPGFEPRTGNPRIFKFDFHQQKFSSLSTTCYVQLEGALYSMCYAEASRRPLTSLMHSLIILQRLSLAAGLIRRQSFNKLIIQYFTLFFFFLHCSGFHTEPVRMSDKKGSVTWAKPRGELDIIITQGEEGKEFV